MKKLMYRDWEVHLFIQVIDDQPNYFAAALEMGEVCVSCESYWEAYEWLKNRLDKVSDEIAAFYANDDDLPF